MIRDVRTYAHLEYIRTLLLVRKAMDKHTPVPAPSSDDELGPQFSMAELRAAMAERGIPITRFAGLAGILPKHLGSILQGKKPATIRIRYRMAYVIRQLELNVEIVDRTDHNIPAIPRTSQPAQP